MSLFGFGKDPGDGDSALSKRDYARTTTDSPDSTSLIPAITGPNLADGTMPPGPVALRLVRIEPYSVTRLAFVVSVALMIVTTVAAAIFWLVLAITGVWGQINEAIASLLSDDTASFDITDYLGFSRVVGGTLVLSGINVILMTALATVGAHLFNLAAALLGGVETTFSKD